MLRVVKVDRSQQSFIGNKTPIFVMSTSKHALQSSHHVVFGYCVRSCMKRDHREFDMLTD